MLIGLRGEGGRRNGCGGGWVGKTDGAEKPETEKEKERARERARERERERKREEKRRRRRKRERRRERERERERASEARRAREAPVVSVRPLRRSRQDCVSLPI
jgi:hypothetical protein